MTDIQLALLFDRFMRRLHMRLNAKSGDFDTENVGPGGGMLLLTIAEMESAQMQELAERVARDKSQMTRAVQSLEKKALVSRSPAPSDARVSLISLTEKGKDVVATIQDVLAETIGEMLSPLTEAEKAQITAAMSRALAAMDR